MIATPQAVGGSTLRTVRGTRQYGEPSAGQLSCNGGGNISSRPRIVLTRAIQARHLSASAAAGAGNRKTRGTTQSRFAPRLRVKRQNEWSTSGLERARQTSING